MIIDAAVIASFRTWDLAISFRDTTAYPDSVIQYALCEADAETGGRGWGVFQDDCHNFKKRGMFLFAAAWLTTFLPDGVNGEVPGEAQLNVAGKAVGDESISYRVAAMQDAGNDFLTYTSFGQAFYRLRRRAAMGARAV